MDKKYYTPSVGELFVGYECEVLNSADAQQRWFKTIIDQKFLPVAIKISPAGIRTPYLSKEDIESLKFDTGRFAVNKIHDGEHQWQITDCEIPVYEGQIKSINELRKLMSWLNIK